MRQRELQHDPAHDPARRRWRVRSGVTLALVGAAAWACTDRGRDVTLPQHIHAPKRDPSYDLRAVYGTGRLTEFRSRAAGGAAAGYDPLATRCMDVQGASPDVGALLNTYRCLNAPQQTFRWDRDGHIRVYVDTPNERCLDAGAAMNEGDPVVTYTCYAGTPQTSHQLWEPVPDEGPTDIAGYSGIRLRRTDRDLCMDVPNGSAAEGTVIRLINCGRNAGGALSVNYAQQWDGYAVTLPTRAVGLDRARGSGRSAEFRMRLAGDRCMDVVGGRSDNGAPVGIYECNGQPWQAFEWASDGHIRVHYGDGRPVKCLDAGASRAQGDPVVLYDCHADAGADSYQRWEQVNDPAGRPSGIRLISSVRDLCMDVPNGATALGTRVILINCGRVAPGGAYAVNAPQRWDPGATLLWADPMTNDQPTPREFVDPTGSGRAWFSVRPDGVVCGTTEVSNLQPDNQATLDMAHIHPERSGAGSPADAVGWQAGGALMRGLRDGPVVGNRAFECVSVGLATAQRLIDAPADFYFNLHTIFNQRARGGIIRGQVRAVPGREPRQPAY